MQQQSQRQGRHPVSYLLQSYCGALASTGGVIVPHMLQHPHDGGKGNNTEDGLRFLCDTLELILHDVGSSGGSGAMPASAALAAKALMKGARLAGAVSVPPSCVTSLVGALLRLQQDGGSGGGGTAGGEDHVAASESSALGTGSRLMAAMFDALSTFPTDMGRSMR